MKNVLASLVLLASTSLASAADMLVTPAWLVEHRGEKNLVLLHVGVPADFEKEHIPGALFVNPQDLAIPRPRGASSSSSCRPTSCARSLEESRASATPRRRRPLRYGLGPRGYGKAISVSTRRASATTRPSSTAACRRGRPWAERSSRPRPTPKAAAPAPGRSPRAGGPIARVDLDFVKANLKAPGVAIVDARKTKFFDGADPGSMPRAGHIPGARSRPLRHTLASPTTNSGRVIRRDGEGPRGGGHQARRHRRELLPHRPAGHRHVLFGQAPGCWAKALLRGADATVGRMLMQERDTRSREAAPAEAV